MKKVLIALWVMAVFALVLYQGAAIERGEKFDVVAFSGALTSVMVSGADAIDKAGKED